ncbi:M28 family metallopeptidase [Paradesertivirga mongoliensis]|uniref:M28 family metallopeptidase n=1 Tax=Paradesertivirga mongoliensis TaxID=2100740 RepID=A0ABW4ZRK2_9SPHI|nr:M28 family peptidase [Pedobacter mongoliensis]
MRIFFLVFFSTVFGNAFTQDLAFSRKIIDTLTSPPYWGRGYTNEGATKTAQFLKAQLESYGLKPLNQQSYLQEFYLSVNTFPGKMEVSLNGIALVPGGDFIVSPDSRGIKESCKLFQKDSLNFVNDENRIVLTIKDKLTWSVAQQTSENTQILVNRSAIQSLPQKIKLNVENRFIKSFKAFNVAGMVRGTAVPDSMIVITAHYDHLGGMGADTYFPGANDNASGIALLLNLARHYAAKPPRYSVVFICFGAEEAGLLGSLHFSQNPLIDLKKIRFLINTDLAGTGQEGITVVNGSVYTREFELLNRINSEGKYLPKVNTRGKAANSDHYWFTEKGVPSFFIYTMGGIKAYHDIYDRASTLPLTEHEDLIRLLIKFNSALMSNH